MNPGHSTAAGARLRSGINNPRTPGLSLRDAWRIFTRQRSARMLGAMLVLALVFRCLEGNWGASDAAVFIALVVLHPFTEWIIHVGILHWRPIRLGRRVIDPELAREHRKHHQQPHNPRYWYIPIRSGVLGYGLSSVVLAWIIPSRELWLSILIASFALGLFYEWTHYLCHTSYRPRTWVYRRLWRNHRLHHFKNEHYWMGVTMLAGDRVLGTQPTPSEVTTSPTCRNILGS